jgi:hypothetical protein
MRLPHPARRAGRAFQERGSTIYRKLRFAIEDDEHLLALIMEMMPSAAFRLEDAAMQKVKVRVE